MMYDGKLLVATGNPAKLSEIRRYIADLPLVLLSLKDLQITQGVEEDGKTFQENALKKARFYSKLSGLPTIAHDGGLEIDFLNREPGVKSRRWPGYEATDEELIQLCLEKLSVQPKENRKARITGVTVFISPGGEEFVDTSAIEGYIAEVPTEKRIPGFPFRSVFIVNKFGKYYCDLTAEEHEEVNHWKLSMERLKPQIKKVYRLV